MMYEGNEKGKVVIVVDAPNYRVFPEGQILSDEEYTIMALILEESGYNLKDVLILPAFDSPKPFKRNLTANELRSYGDDELLPFISLHPRDIIIACGNNALCAVGVNQTPEGVVSFRVQTFNVAGINAIVTVNPYFIFKEPDETQDFWADLQFAKRIIQEKGHPDNVPVTIYDIEKPGDVQLVLDSTKDYPDLAYDFETTDKLIRSADVVTCAFYNGQMLDNTYFGYFWGGYDRLKPRFEQHILNEFKEAFDHLFQEAGKSYNLIAFNKNFDDWMSEHWVGHELPGSQVDVMYNKWNVNSYGPNNLKWTTYRYQGIPEYDKEIDEFVREVKARRGRILTHEDDFRALEWRGIAPEPGKRANTLRWPENVDKGFAAWALVPYKELRLYNVYDAVYTYINYMTFREIIANEDLSRSSTLRERAGLDLLRCQQRGMKLDRKINSDLDTFFERVEKDCEVKVKEEALKIDPTLEDFNPGSNPQLSKLLYGEPVLVPLVDKEPLYAEYGKKAVDELVDKFNNKFYNGFQKVVQLDQAGEWDIEFTKSKYARDFEEHFKLAPNIVLKEMYYKGEYLPQVFTKSGKPSTARPTLETLIDTKDSDLLHLILMLRKASKIRSTFVNGIVRLLDDDDVLHGGNNPIGTKSGRISNREPNMLNFPARVRGQIRCRPGYKFVTWDLKAAEVRIVAAYSGDEALVEAASNTEADIHSQIASKVFNKPVDQIITEERVKSKTLVFGLIYGMGLDKLALATKMTLEEAKEFYKTFFEPFPNLQIWLNEQVENAKKPPYYTYTAWGTRRSTRNVLSIDKEVRSHAERVAKNHSIQGSAGELVLYYTIQCLDLFRKYELESYFVNNTYDSVTFEVREEHVDQVIEIVKFVVEESPAPVEPLNRVRFAMDLKVEDHWYGEPEPFKAIDPKFKEEGSKVRWDLILTKDELDKEVIQELEDIEEGELVLC